MLPVSASLSLIPSDKEVFEKISQELQSNILECECGAMEEFQ